MRKLDNKSENLVLVDAWGNIIDQVHYADTLPWPTEADGNGPFLQLKDLDSDNSLPESWTTSYDLTGFEERQSVLTHLYPNPTTGKVYVELEGSPISCQVMNLMGNVIKEMAISSAQFEIDLSRLPSGMYLIKAQMADGTTAYEKVVKY